MYYSSRICFTVFSVPLIAVCIFDWNLPSKDFRLCLFSENLNRISNRVPFLRWFWVRSQKSFFGFCSGHHNVVGDFPVSISPTYIGIFGLFGANMDSSDQFDRKDFPSFIILVSFVLGFDRDVVQMVFSLVPCVLWTALLLMSCLCFRLNCYRLPYWLVLGFSLFVLLFQLFCFRYAFAVGNIVFL